ncbi:helix-turn-helix transcriptional regulator [Thermophilibacter mediterraneus]|uniref:helix-turn-helix transcriptional regulator n=1 Tax=Thermophilibacter mediterraneus TaxID=1871031 RepID=UPI00320A139A
MSFRDNLQHLRATRNMTQEQLAMLLGVSRQSVTKWEAEKSYPEMDKLLKLCQIFECSLDDLVQGDLTARVTETRAASVPAGPPTDVCGFDEHQRRLARQVPAGVAAILVGCGLGFLAEGRFALLGADADVLTIVLILLGVLVGLAFFIPAGMEHAAFVRAHPYVEDFYTEDDRVSARRSFTRAMVAGIALIFAGSVCIMVLGDDRATEREGLCLLMLFLAAGVWLIVRYGMLLGRTNVAEYNRSVAEDLEVEEIASAQVDEEVREALLERKRSGDRVAAVCGVIMIVATIVAFILLFAPVFSEGDPSSFRPEGTSAMWFWMSWVVGGLLCAIVSILMGAFGRRD